MGNRLSQAGRKGPPSTQVEIEQFASRLKASVADLSNEQLDSMDRELEAAYAGGFDHRDEANALIAFAVRNGPLENLHAGKRSALLDDDSLSRVTDEEMKVLMIQATRALAGLLRLRDSAPKEYRRFVLGYAKAYCKTWEREK
jgi:hypothetical protein